MLDHEELRVYQEALKFAARTEIVLQQTKKADEVYDQLDRARTSILLNIAEGNGRHTAADRCRFFDIARGSALECAACLDLLSIKKVVPPMELQSDKEILKNIVSMLVGLIRNNSTERMHEASVSYRLTAKSDYDYGQD